VKKRSKITLRDLDVAFVFREEGTVEVSFPEVHTETAPDHILAALALSHMLVDEALFQSLKDQFIRHLRLPKVKVAVNDI
jgi:hypothetical protein